MRNTELPDNLRAAFIRLTMHLWVNRNPQENLVVPALTRAWSPHGAEKAEIPHADKITAFFLLQDVILLHLKQCGATTTDSRAFHKLTLEMACLLRTLMPVAVPRNT